MPGTNNDKPEHVIHQAQEKRNVDLLRYPETIGSPHTPDDGLEQIRVWLEFKDSAESQYEKYAGEKRTQWIDKGDDISLGITKSKRTTILK